MWRAPLAWISGLAIAAGALWAPFLGRSLSPDEGGLLVVAGQWSHGSSLYGDYFVDRPPILIAVFSLADWAGGPWALRIIGLLAVVAAVALSGLVGYLAAPGIGLAPVLPAATTAILVSTPLFGSTVVNGEMLGLPFLLAAAAALIAAYRSTTTAAALGWGATAGVAGALAALVKQSLLDAFVLALVLTITNLRPRRATAVRVLIGYVVGAGSAVVVTVWAAALRGTDPVDLWDAVVVFRREATHVIADSASSTTTQRLGLLLIALVASCAPLVAAALVRSMRGRSASSMPDLRLPAYAVIAWELVVVASGGSYWLHYLMGLIPGLALLAAAAVQRPLLTHRFLKVAYALAAVSTICAVAWVVVDPIHRPERPAVAYLEQHARPGDTVVVGFGAANILQETGLRSPYPDLWSLPVRVHDPDLQHLSALLAGPDAPTWLVVAGTSLGTWGVDATTADSYLHARYEPATTAGKFTIYHLTDSP